MGDVDLRLLERGDDRSHFNCGEPAIDRFFQHYAGQNQFKLHLAVTYVATRGADLLGYATVTGGSLERDHLPDEVLRRRLPSYPLPVLRLARMGVDLRAQRLGIGLALVRHVFRLALGQRDTVGCIGVVTDAKPGAVAFYESLGFTPFVGVREGLLHGKPLPMFLHIGTIAASMPADAR